MMVLYVVILSTYPVHTGDFQRKIYQNSRISSRYLVFHSLESFRPVQAETSLTNLVEGRCTLNNQDSFQLASIDHCKETQISFVPSHSIYSRLDYLLQWVGPT
jgi:hypothetical protein